MFKYLYSYEAFNFQVIQLQLIKLHVFIFSKYLCYLCIIDGLFEVIFNSFAFNLTKIF
jgi:hypothetical protein